MTPAHATTLRSSFRTWFPLPWPGTDGAGAASVAAIAAVLFGSAKVLNPIGIVPSVPAGSPASKSSTTGRRGDRCGLLLLRLRHPRLYLRSMEQDRPTQQEAQ